MRVGAERVRKLTLKCFTCAPPLPFPLHIFKPCNSRSSVGAGGLKPPCCSLCARSQRGGGQGMSTGHEIMVRAWHHCMNGDSWGHE